MTTPYLLAIAIYLWAGLWITWGMPVFNAARRSPWDFFVYFASFLAWGIAFPVVRLIKDVERRKLLREFDQGRI